MKSKARVVSILAVATILVGLSASPAFADGGAAVTGAQAYWVSSTKTLSATDTQSDGKSAIAQLRRGTTGSISEVVNSNGNGTTKNLVVSVSSGADIYLRACTQDVGGGGSRTCGAWVQRVA
jgi:hypothetical protein